TLHALAATIAVKPVPNNGNARVGLGRAAVPDLVFPHWPVFEVRAEWIAFDRTADAIARLIARDSVLTFHLSLSLSAPRSKRRGCLVEPEQPRASLLGEEIYFESGGDQKCGGLTAKP